MGLLISKIDSLEYHQKFAFYDLAAHTLAAQALAAAGAVGIRVCDENVRTWIEAVADYPGVTNRHLNEEKTLMLGERAEQIAMFLLGAAERVKNQTMI